MQKRKNLKSSDSEVSQKEKNKYTLKHIYGIQKNDTDDTTLMAESEEELKSLLIRMREESEKAG